MKALFSKFLFGTLLFWATSICAQVPTYIFKVSGNCGMCKDRIEKTAKEAGAQKAEYSLDHQILTLTTESSKTDAILKKIAEVGHDNEKYKADDKVYANLPGCCLYERTIEPQLNPSHHNHKSESYFVKGNCSSCKKRIEKAALDAGVKRAVWDAETQTLNVDFNQNITSKEKILKKIAEVGHDNEMFNTTEEVYKNLPACCLYDRSLKKGEKNPNVHGDTEKKTSEHHEDNTTQINQVNLIHTKASTALNKKEAGLIFHIDKKELLKAACCNLSESFETNATVDVSFSNAVTGTKQLKMLGLDQKYTLITKELLPEIRGLGAAFGLTFIPGRWIESIQLTKGGSTVTSGYESITGQINTELPKHSEKATTAMNVFADMGGRAEANITHVAPINQHWTQSILLHGNGTFGDTDDNKDGFLDRPKGDQINMAYLINYNDLESSGWGTHFGIHYLKDRRNAGQVGFDYNKPQTEQDLYGVQINSSRFQTWNKTGYIFKGKPYQSIGWMNQLTYHQQNSFYGFRNYDGKQTSYFSNLIFESIIGNTNHKYKVGASFLFDSFDEMYLDTPYKRNERVPGLFAEYTLSGAKYTFVAGLRGDFHNLAGSQISPRLNFKYDITPKTILRLSAGRGFRTANIFAENQQFFASNREIKILNNGGYIYGLNPEIAWNYGASLQQEFKLFNRKSSIVADYFRTDFQDQVVVDLDASAQEMRFYNLDGKSYANSLQVQWDFIPIRNLEVRLAYKYYDVKADYTDGRREIPFMAKNRSFLNLAYSTNKTEKGSFWSFDTTLNWVGKQRLPLTSSNPLEYQKSNYSEDYVVLNAQLARVFNPTFRAYIGAENITSTYQKNAIIDFQNPFSSYFDGGMVYAPLMKANVYVGLDITL